MPNGEKQIVLLNGPWLRVMGIVIAQILSRFWSFTPIRFWILFTYWIPVKFAKYFRIMYYMIRKYFANLTLHAFKYDLYTIRLLARLRCTYIVRLNQGLLKLLWTVYSEGKLQSCLKLRNFQNPFNKDKSVGL